MEGSLVQLERPRAALAGVVPVAAPVAALLFLVVAVLAVFDVSVGTTLAYLGYELAYVVVPGMLVVLALTGARTLGLQSVALGVGAGYGLEVGAFVLTAATGSRGLFPWWPLAAVLVAAPFVRVRSLPARPQRSTPVWLLAALAAVLVGFLANAILDTPLPRQSYALRGYPVDMIWSTSATAEAMHHWPLQVPGFVGRALHYHYFVYLHLAGAARVTGIDAWTLNFRLFPLWATLVLAFELFVVGRTVANRSSAGLLAAFVVLLAGSIMPFGQPSEQVREELIVSITFALGAIVWLPLLLALWLLLVAPPPAVRQWSLWILATGLAIVAAGAKAPVDIVAAAGLGVVALTRLRRREAHPTIGAAAAITIVFGGAWAVLYRSTNGSVTLKPLATIKGYEPFALVAKHVPSLLLEPFWAVVALLIAAKILAAFLPGLAAAVAWRPRREAIFLGAPLLVGMVFLFAFANLGSSEAYFAWYGELAGAVLAGIGLDELGRRLLRPVALPRALVVGGVALLLVVWTFESPVDPVQKTVWQNVSHGGGETPEYAGFRWIAAHTSPGTVLAVDARSTPTNCFQTAFAERRALIDCYFGFAPEQTLESVSQLRGTLPAPLFREVERRLRLNDAIFRGDGGALATAARRYGVRYVVVDRASGGTAAQVAALARVAEPVFRNASVDVFRVRSVT